MTPRLRLLVESASADGRVFIDIAGLPEAPYLVQVSTSRGRATTWLMKR